MSSYLFDEIQAERALTDPPVGGLWAALISQGATGPGAQIHVTIPDLDANAVFVPVWWLPIADLLPARGDACLVAIDNQSNVWVIAWSPAA